MKYKYKIKKIIDFSLLIIGIIVVSNILLHKSLPFMYNPYTRDDANIIKINKQFHYLYNNLEVNKSANENLINLKNKAEKKMLNAIIVYRNLCLNLKTGNDLYMNKEVKNIIKTKDLCKKEYKKIINKIYGQLTKNRKD